MNIFTAVRTNRTLMSLVTVAVVVVALFGVAIPHADAAASVGLSSNCIKTHCVIAKGTGVSGGTSVTKGYFVGTCAAVADGALITEVTCSALGQSRTRSLPGTAAEAELLIPVTSLDPVTICWSATAYYPNLSGGTTSVSTSGCGITV